MGKYYLQNDFSEKISPTPPPLRRGEKFFAQKIAKKYTKIGKIELIKKIYVLGRWHVGIRA
ncbi:MAG: hypothetical protein GY782_10040 [Gammaproteobacteria bacterium]|nr:hypothetical protein [Gammaproteobacteria bacterium]